MAGLYSLIAFGHFEEVAKGVGLGPHVVEVLTSAYLCLDVVFCHQFRVPRGSLCVRVGCHLELELGDGSKAERAMPSGIC